MRDVFVCDAVRTPIGRFGGSLAKVRADDLAAAPIKALVAKHPKLDWASLDEVFFGCANQAGEDNRNVARMAILLAGLPESIPGQTLNRLCASGLDAVGAAGRAIRAGEIDFAIAGGVESMTRAPFVMGKATEAFSRSAEIFDTTIGWRFINPLMKQQYGVDSMPETGENVAEEFQVSRADQDAFAIRSQQRAGAAIASGFFAEEITPVTVRGGTAAEASPRMRARGVRPCFFTAASDARISAAAPSFTPDALPAVTVPGLRTIGFSFARPSNVVSGRGCSSLSTTTGPALPPTMVMGVISSAK